MVKLCTYLICVSYERFIPLKHFFPFFDRSGRGGRGGGGRRRRRRRGGRRVCDNGICCQIITGYPTRHRCNAIVTTATLVAVLVMVVVAVVVVIRIGGTIAIAIAIVAILLTV